MIDGGETNSIDAHWMKNWCPKFTKVDVVDRLAQCFKESVMDDDFNSDM